jgi:hypothetical protein
VGAEADRDRREGGVVIGVLFVLFAVQLVLAALLFHPLLLLLTITIIIIIALVILVIIAISVELVDLHIAFARLTLVGELRHVALELLLVHCLGAILPKVGCEDLGTAAASTLLAPPIGSRARIDTYLLILLVAAVVSLLHLF